MGCSMRKIAGLTFALTVLVGCAGGGEVYEERVTYDHGVARECGEGPGLSPCRDASGETYAEEMDPNYIGFENHD